MSGHFDGPLFSGPLFSAPPKINAVGLRTVMHDFYEYYRLNNLISQQLLMFAPHWDSLIMHDCVRQNCSFTQATFVNHIAISFGFKACETMQIMQIELLVLNQSLRVTACLNFLAKKLKRFI